ncbi:MAG: bacterioferritin-associated ferredoxin [Myxococcales bacterium]
MLVCVCRGVSDRELRDVLARGASTLRDVGRACGAGTDCGSCRDLLRNMLGSCAAQGCEAPPGATRPEEQLERQR